ncbi:MAG: hypothetical protein KC910_29020 [Candidatus Eremiobacteraeota bacterium]|nr:hypothetical protein [Candidatus Eremiobacteraeota bacterium]
MRGVLAGDRLLLLTVLSFLVSGPALAEGTGWKAQVGDFLTQPPVAGALLIVGVVALAAAVITLGSGVAEVTAFCAIGLFFAGRYLAGEDIWVPLALFVGGLICLALEIFVLPGVGVFGVIGILGIGGSTVLCFDNWETGLTVFLSALCAAMLGGFALFKFLPENRLFRGLIVLEPPVSPPTPAVVSSKVEIGSVGVCSSPLRPGGIAEFEGRRVDVVTEGAFIAKGHYVEVVSVQGNKVVVRATPGQD